LLSIERRPSAAMRSFILKNLSCGAWPRIVG